MAQDLFSQIALQTLGGIGPSAAPGRPAVSGGDDPVSAIFQVAQERGIDPAHLLGLAKLETRAGEKTIKGDGTDTRNLFNVKDFSKAGDGIRARDNAEGSNDRYRTYGSYRESAEDLVGLLERKYPAALRAKSPEEFAQALKAGGYATDPLYERKLANTIRGSAGSLANVRPVQSAQEWDQGARYIPMDLMLGGTNKPQPAEKPKEGAGFWEGTADVGLAAAQGVVGSVKAITDLAGADNAVSRSLDDASKGIEKTKSNASQADRKYHQQKIREAEASGDWKDEVAAYANMVWDMPLESLAQGIGSFATLGAGKVAQMAKLASAAKKAGVTKEAFLKTAQGVEAAKQASNLGAKVNVGLGVSQGIGGVKGSQYEQTFNAAKEGGLSDEQAQALATEAQSYQQGWGQQLVGAGLGYLAGKTGPIEKLASGQTVGAGGVARRFVGGGLVEAGTEGLQGGQERYAGNAAAIDAGVLDDSRRWAGVAGSGASEAITAGVLGGGAGALGRPDVDPQAQAKAAAQKSGGIVSRAGLAATPGAQQPAGQPGQTATASVTSPNAAPGANSAAAGTPPTPNPLFDGIDDEGLENIARALVNKPTLTDGTPITDEDRAYGQEALAELQRRRLAAKAGPAPAAKVQNPIQASALSAIEQALEADKQRRRAAGEVVEDDVTDVEVKAGTPPAAPTAGPATEADPMLPQAIDVLRQGGRPSVSQIQRQLKIGFNRAARLLEEMESQGIVSAMDEQGLRQILKLPDPPDAQANTPAQPAPSAGFSLPAFDNSPIPKMDPAAADEQRRQAAAWEQKRKVRRAATRSAAWDRNPFLAFLGANGINRDVANEFAPGLVEKRKAFVPGYGPVFRSGAKNLDELVQTAKEDGFLREDDDVPELYDLIERSLRGERIAPLYADGAAEAEGQRRQQEMMEREGATFEDYLQQAEADDFDPFPLMADSGYDAQDLAGTDFDQADDAVRAEVAALAAQYADLGFDPADVLESLSVETENQPEQAYYDRARTRLTDLINQAYAQAQPQGNRAVRADRAEPLPAGEAGARGPAAGQQVKPAAPTPKLRNVDELAAEGFNQVVKQGGKTYFVNPDTRESVELDSPAQIARARARVQAKQRLGSLRGTRPQPFGLDAVTPEALKAREEQAQAAQAQQTAEQQAAADKAKADDERRRIEQASYAAADNFQLGQNPLDSLTGQQDIFSTAPVSSPVAADLAGERINGEWVAFDPQSGTLGIPRAQMPQIKAEHRGAMVNFLKARGIDGQQETIPSAAIKPTQAEFSPAKVKQAMDYQGGNRSIIVSADGYVVDGHHQWLAAREKGEPIPAIRLDQNIGDVLTALKDMPSAQPEKQAKRPTQKQAQKVLGGESLEQLKKKVKPNADAFNKFKREGSEREFQALLEKYQKRQETPLSDDEIDRFIDLRTARNQAIYATENAGAEVDYSPEENPGAQPEQADADDFAGQLEAIARELEAIGAPRRAAAVREWMSGDLPPSAGDVKDAQDLLDQAKMGLKPDPVAELLNQHFKLNAELQAAFVSGMGDAKNQLYLMDESDRVARKLIELGYTQNQLGANALGVTVDHFKEMVKDGIYSKDYGARDELFKKPANLPPTMAADEAPELAGRWAAMTPSEREDAVRRAGWSTAKDTVNLTGRGITKQSWADMVGSTRKRVADAMRQSDSQAPAVAPVKTETAKAADPYPLVEHTTAKGKVLRGYIVHGMTLDEVKASIDPYALKKDGGVFVREQHKDKLPKPATSSSGRGPAASQAWKDEGKSPADLIAEKAQSVGRELAVQVAEESREQDFRPSEIPQAVEQWAADASVPADDLKRVLLQELPSLGVSEARIQQIRAALYPASKPATRDPSAGRAAAGGQVGVNGYFYKGGQFLPTTMAEPGKWKLDGKWVTSGREEVAPREWGHAPTPFSRSIYAMINAWTDLKDGKLSVRDGIRDYQGNPVTPDTEIRPGVRGVQGQQALTLQELIDAWNAGQRWFDVQPNAKTITTQEQTAAEPVQQDSQAAAGQQGIITADDVAAAEKQVAQMIEARIDGMKVADVQRIAARFLPTVGVKVPTGKAKIKVAMTDATAMNLLGPAGELGIELSESVKRALVAKMEGRVGVSDTNQALDLDAQLAQVNAELATQGMVQNANTRSKRDQLRKAIAERDFPEIFQAVDGDVSTAEDLHQAFQVSGNEPKAQTIERVLKRRGITEEYRKRWAERLLAGAKPAGREGYDTPVELDAAQLKTILEQTRGEPLATKPAKLEAWRNGTSRTDPAKFPIELFLTPDGKLDVNDGRHRIALAAERGEKVTAFIDGKDAQRVKDMLKAAPGTRFNGDLERAAADRLEKLYAKMDNIMQRNTREGAAKAAVRSVIEELRKPRTASSIVPMLDGAANGLDKQYSAMADVIREVADSLSGNAIQDFIDGKRNMAPTLEEVQTEQAASQAAANADLEAIFDQLDGLTQRTQANGQQAAAAHPQAERIQFVQKHILDILQDLEDSGKVSINC